MVSNPTIAQAQFTQIGFGQLDALGSFAGHGQARHKSARQAGRSRFVPDGQLPELG